MSLPPGRPKEGSLQLGGTARSASNLVARTAVRLVVVVLAAVALLPPLLWVGVGALIEHHRVAGAAESIAWLLDESGRDGSVVPAFPVPTAAPIPAAVSVYPAPRVPVSDAIRLLGQQPFNADHGLRSLNDEQGNRTAIVGSERAAAWPSLVATRALRVARSGAKVVEVRHSLRPLLWTSALVALASSAIAFALWALAFDRPARALELAERKSRSFAMRDALTGLPNRAGLRLVLELAFARRHGTRRALGLLAIDLDRFHLVNASLGWDAGDQLLRSVAGRIRAVVRDGDVIARVGPDQFVIMVEAASGLQALAAMARNLLRAFDSAHKVGDSETVATLSIGIAIAIADEHDDSVGRLLQRAETAMRAVKAEGGGRFRSYDPIMQQDRQSHLELDRRLRIALQEGAFLLLYQPIMDASGRRIVAVESLLRWNDPSRGMVSPADFIPVLEQTGLIVSVGTWVLREACRRGRSWIDEGARSLVLSVNVSPRQFAEPDFVATVSSILAQTRFPAAGLQLEVTEGLLLDPTPESLGKIAALVGIGVRLAVDDFGMGYSSLAYLKTFPLHTLKIDRMFVCDIPQSQRDATIVRAIVDLGHGLGLHVTAEGVETAEQFHALRALGCDSVQGYLFSRPVSAEVMQGLLARTRTGDPDGCHPSPNSRAIALSRSCTSVVVS